ncbi:rod shape-determining protein MreD [Clostridium thermosuccinogenes]|jgi:rod shape-determining protein MreD|uniref:Rod shape-determining protein MreD n=1 Tax=Clostridium thermosuccinogenes TaxID=84032 RepID=A0A2K2F8F2_9CLOT|nr:rod shape-determining protein MreD [Pseudoclostridium thermosuccinogenes]AUS97704.1 rod shape-determining protein MreD [Pseudoclostridium thermosuccinogenes]PNT93947.1 rod shape-determining protein MreD [Pseudoclostridium thermosuccinogenes]PNT95060.1 rod shape-determining protein MreD [Pseudoclostridium thermosuccinogenes]PNT95781.1 rod shape-determining protein MreD [Pseudoclostridium thermosuccinogenes]
MRRKIVAYSACLFVLGLIQSTVLDYIRVFNVKPNLLLAFVVVTALLRGNMEGAVIGFLSGLCLDVISGKLIGFYTLLCMYIGLIIGSVNKRLYRENFLIAVFFTFVATFTYEYTVYFFSIFLKGKGDLLFPLKAVILPEAVYNCVLSIPLFIIMLKLHYAFEDAGRASRKY